MDDDDGDVDVMHFPLFSWMKSHKQANKQTNNNNWKTMQNTTISESNKKRWQNQQRS